MRKTVCDTDWFIWHFTADQHTFRLTQSITAENTVINTSSYEEESSVSLRLGSVVAAGEDQYLRRRPWTVHSGRAFMSASLDSSIRLSNQSSGRGFIVFLQLVRDHQRELSEARPLVCFLTNTHAHTHIFSNTQHSSFREMRGINITHTPFPPAGTRCWFRASAIASS